MRRIIKGLFIGLLLLVFTGCTLTSDNTLSQVYEALLEDVDLTNVQENLDLPTLVDGVVISWSTSDVVTLEPDGTIHRQQTDRTVYLYATLRFDDRVDEKEFIVVVRAAEYEYDSRIQAVHEGLMTGIDLENVVNHLDLPTLVEGVTIRWETSNPQVISTSGQVLRQQENESVTLTAYLDLGSYQLQKTFQLTVLKVEGDHGLLLLEAIDSVDLDAVPGDSIVLPTVYGEVSITWTSSHPEIVSSEGEINRVDQEILVTLTAVFSYLEHEQTFDFQVLITSKHKLTVVEDELLTGITFYTLNDFHGAIFEDGDEVGIARLSAYLRARKNSYPENVVIVSAGDMFQGTAVASMTRGRVVVDAMNLIGFDAMALGNHEFDWGVDEITKFFDGIPDNGEANFPFLGANIYVKSTLQRAEWAQPYSVIERNGVRIGIIGTLGEYQTSSILASISDPFMFVDQLNAIRDNARILRTVENVDIVVAMSHSDTTSINQSLADLTGDERIDLVVNGHTHRYYAGEVSRASGGVPMPYVQSGNNGRYIGKITLEMNFTTKTITDVSATNIYAFDQAIEEDEDILAIFDNYQAEIAIAEEFLGIAGQTVLRDQGAQWAADVMWFYNEGTDIGIVNSGGIRSVGFPVYSGDAVYYADIFKMMPFENMVNKVLLSGAQVKQLLSNSGDLVFSSNVDQYGQTINGLAIVNSQYYRISTMDYVFEQTRYPFLSGQDIQYPGILFRDQMVQAVKDSVERSDYWYLNVE